MARDAVREAMRVAVPKGLHRMVAMVLLAVPACGGSEAAQDGTPRAQETSVAQSPVEFDGAAAMAYVRAQMAFGPRVPGSPAHRNTADWLVKELQAKADTVIVQSWTHTAADGRRLPLRNVFARFNPAASERILYLAHWDSRPISEKETSPSRRNSPVPGANDGASGVAVLLGVADALKARRPDVGVDLLFVDGEDWGDFDTNTDVLIGSRYFAQQLPVTGYQPAFGVLFDMVGKPNAQFLYESNSVRAAPDVVQRVWSLAAARGHGAFFPTREWGAITDDHVPLIALGWKVIDLIDIEYAYHHTTDDTEDKLSQETLQVVGDVAVALIRGGLR